MASFSRLLDYPAVVEKLKECLLELDSLDEEMQEMAGMQAEDERRDAFNFDPKDDALYQGVRNISCRICGKIRAERLLALRYGG